MDQIYIYNGPSGTVPAVGKLETGQPIKASAIPAYTLAEWLNKKWLIEEKGAKATIQKSKEVE